jgi:hypothetical protein
LLRRSVALAALLAALLAPVQAFAAAEVHRLNLALSGLPTSIGAGDFNDSIDRFNTVTLSPLGYEPLAKVSFSWLFDADLRYFVTRNLAVTAGVGQLRAASKKEYLPAVGQSIDVRADLLTAPVHVGAAYYLQPYNQGDFQARMFVGGGLVSYTHSRSSLSMVLTGTDSVTTLGLTGNYKRYKVTSISTQDAPGYYGEAGVQMFFASRYSILLSGVYRSGVVQDLVDEKTGAPVLNPITGKPASLDVGGLGLRMAAVIGL